MPQVIFTFTINTDTQEGNFAGNVEPKVALNILQQLVIADAVKRNNGDVHHEEAVRNEPN